MRLGANLGFLCDAEPCIGWYRFLVLYSSLLFNVSVRPSERYQTPLQLLVQNQLSIFTVSLDPEHLLVNIQSPPRRACLSPPLQINMEPQNHYVLERNGRNHGSIRIQGGIAVWPSDKQHLDPPVLHLYDRSGHLKNQIHQSGPSGFESKSFSTISLLRSGDETSTFGGRLYQMSSDNEEDMRNHEDISKKDLLHILRPVKSRFIR